MDVRLIVDLEATCDKGHSLPAEEQETIEIGAVILQDQEVAATFSRFIRPMKHPVLTEFCKELTTIPQELIDVSDRFPTVFREFVSWTMYWETEGCLYSWGRFDIDQLNRDCAKWGLVCPFSHIDLSATFQREVGRLPHRKAMKCFGLTPKGTQHRGIDDAINIAAVAVEMIKRGWL